MRLAIPYFRSRIAPRFDHAQHVLLLTIESGKVVEEKPMQMPFWNFVEKLQLMKDHKVDVFICGGIDRQSMTMLRASGMEVLSWITGEVRDAVGSFLDGDLKSGATLGKKRERLRHRRGERRRDEQSVDNCSI